MQVQNRKLVVNASEIIFSYLPMNILPHACVCAVPVRPVMTSKQLEHQRSTLRLLITTVRSLASRSTPTDRSQRFGHTPARSACIASARAVPSSCIACILTAAPPSSLSWLSCGRLVLFDHRNPIACDHTGAFLVQRARPSSSVRECSYLRF